MLDVLFKEYNRSFVFVCVVIFVSFICDVITDDISNELILKLYSKYKEAFDDDLTVSTRRLYTRNHQFQIHVKKLKSVNGLKRHNLMIKDEVDDQKNPLIYIDNPVESKIPNAYLTLKEFKKALTLRVLEQRQEVLEETKDALRTLKLLTISKNNTSKKVTKKSSKEPSTSAFKITNTNAKSYEKKVKNPILNVSNFKSSSKILPERITITGNTKLYKDTTTGLEVLNITTERTRKDDNLRTISPKKFRAFKTTSTLHSLKNSSLYPSVSTPAFMNLTTKITTEREYKTTAKISEAKKVHEKNMKEDVKTTSRRTRRTLGVSN